MRCYNATMSFTTQDIEWLMNKLKELSDHLDGLVPLNDGQEQQIAELHSRITQGFTDLLEITKRELRRRGCGLD
jgi:hypothetical protein